MVGPVKMTFLGEVERYGADRVTIYLPGADGLSE